MFRLFRGVLDDFDVLDYYRKFGDVVRHDGDFVFVHYGSRRLFGRFRIFGGFVRAESRRRVRVFVRRAVFLRCADERRVCGLYVDAAHDEHCVKILELVKESAQNVAVMFSSILKLSPRVAPVVFTVRVLRVRRFFSALSPSSGSTSRWIFTIAMGDCADLQLKSFWLM